MVKGEEMDADLIELLGIDSEDAPIDIKFALSSEKFTQEEIIGDLKSILASSKANQTSEYMDY